MGAANVPRRPVTAGGRRVQGMKRTPEVALMGNAWTKPHVSAEALHRRTLFHLKYTRCKEINSATEYDKFVSLAHAVRDLAMDLMITTQGVYLEQDVKRVYYLSMEFLIGRILRQNALALGVLSQADSAIRHLGISLDRVLNIESEAGLGNGGLGRLAACYLDSLATHEYPAYGYGIRYEHGMFRQEFRDGWQVEIPDDWLKYGSPWEMVRPEYTVPVMVYGRVEHRTEADGSIRPSWVDWQMFEGVPHDVPIIGYRTNTVNFLRLWSSRATQSFRLDVFNTGDYVGSVEEKNWAENISKVLYPSENTSAGKELRLLQEYFLARCSIADIIRRYRKNHSSWEMFSEKNAIQLNETHAALAIVELMRHFTDEVRLPWHRAWDLTVQTFGFTNHTLLPEALEKWPEALLQRMLPRHLQIIWEINHRFLQHVRLRYPEDTARVQRMSLIAEEPARHVRMAHLAIVGSHSINGVSEIHSDLIRTRLVPEFAEYWPERFNNKTNGITQRLWLLASNPDLAALISRTIGDDWIRDLDGLKALAPYAEDDAFRKAFAAIKRGNKERLAQIIQQRLNLTVSPDSLFDVQIKRLHEYKRQLLKLMHIVTLYHRIKDDPDAQIVPRTFLFGAKAAPGYYMAKLIIKLINTVGARINSDPDVEDRLKVAFLPDYCVSLAEAIVPAADLSEQISTAGTEASGTGNMKLALNGALTVGTWDGANIEIAREVGPDNIFIFGMKAADVEAARAAGTYDPAAVSAADPELAEVVEAIRDNLFLPSQPDLFKDVYNALTVHGDYYFHLADYRDYVDTQGRIDALYRNPDEWNRKAILNVAAMGRFSSDRSVREYAEGIWRTKPVPIDMGPPGTHHTMQAE
jgi:starch phosphorylase